MPDNRKKTILGIDPGIERVGIAVLQRDPLEKPKETLLFSECFMTDKILPAHERLALIHEKIEAVIREYRPDVVAIEKIFFSVNQKTAITVAQARGAILAALGGNIQAVIELSPTEIKESITGSGRADKDAIARMLPLILPSVRGKNQDDELDAIAVALAASARIGYSQL